MVYKLVSRHRMFGDEVSSKEGRGRPKSPLTLFFSLRSLNCATRRITGVRSSILSRQAGFSVSRRKIQQILDLKGLTEPCVKRRGTASMCVFSGLSQITCGMWITVNLKANNMLRLSTIEVERLWLQENLRTQPRRTRFCFHQAVLSNEVCPVIVLSDKGTQFLPTRRQKVENVRSPNLNKNSTNLA